ncbi:MAG: hypothetical protein ACKOBR_09655, partial [Actinomycetota bacterium]
LPERKRRVEVELRHVALRDVRITLDQVGAIQETLHTIGLPLPGDEGSAWQGQANRVQGFLNRADLVERYARITKRDVSQLDFYTSFAFWKLACIIEGVYARYLGGALGDRSADELAPFAAQVEAAVTSAHRYLARLP